MDISKTDREYALYKLGQANEALEDARGLLADGAELSYVVNSLFYAFYYPVLVLLHSKGIPAAMQSVSIALFDKEFVRTGEVDQRLFRALCRTFEVKPKCSEPQLNMISLHEAEALLNDASEFLSAVGRMVGDVRPTRGSEKD